MDLGPATDVWVVDLEKLGMVKVHAEEPKACWVNKHNGSVRCNRSHLVAVRQPANKPQQQDAGPSNPLSTSSDHSLSRSGQCVAPPLKFAPRPF